MIKAIADIIKKNPYGHGFTSQPIASSCHIPGISGNIIDENFKGIIAEKRGKKMRAKRAKKPLSPQSTVIAAVDA